MKVVNDSGVLIRMTDRDFTRYLRAGAAGANPEPSDFGKPFADIAFHAQDASPSGFQDSLSRHTKRAASK